MCSDRLLGIQVIVVTVVKVCSAGTFRFAFYTVDTAILTKWN